MSIDMNRLVNVINQLTPEQRAALTDLLAQDDKATLPDSEVVGYLYDNGSTRTYWQRDGQVSRYRGPDKMLMGGFTPTDPEKYFPLPVYSGQTITPEQHEELAIALCRAVWGREPGDSWPPEATDVNKKAWRRRASDAIAALRLVVADPGNDKNGD